MKLTPEERLEIAGNWYPDDLTPERLDAVDAVLEARGYSMLDGLSAEERSRFEAEMMRAQEENAALLMEEDRADIERRARLEGRADAYRDAASRQFLPPGFRAEFEYEVKACEQQAKAEKETL